MSSSGKFFSSNDKVCSDEKKGPSSGVVHHYNIFSSDDQKEVKHSATSISEHIRDRPEALKAITVFEGIIKKLTLVEPDTLYEEISGRKYNTLFTYVFAGSYIVVGAEFFNVFVYQNNFAFFYMIGFMVTMLGTGLLLAMAPVILLLPFLALKNSVSWVNYLRLTRFDKSERVFVSEFDLDLDESRDLLLPKITKCYTKILLINEVSQDITNIIMSKCNMLDRIGSKPNSPFTGDLWSKVKAQEGILQTVRARRAR